LNEKPIYIRHQPQRCPIHKTWMRKGKCEPCMLAEDRRRRAAELEAGIVKQPIKIGKL
jgi:hypothetical protein